MSKYVKHWYIISLILICVLAAALHFYRLGDVPHGIAWDEAAIGYNGFAIWTTRRDEWLQKLPVSFKSFGDYKAPLAIYVSGFFTFLFGLNVWAVRLPFALASIVSILAIMLLTEILFRTKKNDGAAKMWSIVTGLIVLTSPWDFHFSRIAFETGMALTLMCAGFYFFFRMLFTDQKLVASTRKTSTLQAINAVLAAGFLVLSMYAYHSTKIAVPLLGLVIIALYWKEFLEHKTYMILFAAAGFLFCWPLIHDVLWGNGSARFTQASIFGHGVTMQGISLFFQHFYQQFSLQYLVFGETPTLRHGDGHWGILLPTSLFLLLAGIWALIWKVYKKEYQNPEKRHEIRLLILSFNWMIIGSLPAIIGVDVPHSNRALIALPGFILLGVLGLKFLIEWLRKTKLNAAVSGSKGERDLLVKSVIGVLILLHALTFIAYLHEYFTVFAAASASDFSDGYIQAMQYVAQNENDADKILFTSNYGQPYIYALFVRKTNPIWYQGGSLVKYEFTDTIKDGDRFRNNAIIVATPTEIDPKWATKLIYGSDGKVRFVIVRTPPQNQ